MRVKLMTATAVIVAAFGLTGGAAYLSKADAQPAGPGGNPLRPGVGDPFGSLPGTGNPNTQPGVGGAIPTWTPSPTTWEYKFVDVKNDRKEFEKTITQHGKEGWEYCGSERFGQSGPVLVFKKSKGGFGAGIGVPGMPGPGGGFNRDSGAAPGTESQSFKLKHADGPEVARLVTNVFRTTQSITIHWNHTDHPEVLYVRTNPETMKEVARLIEELDAKLTPKPKPDPKPGAAEGIKKPEEFFNVFNLENANAVEMEVLVKKLFPNVDVVADQRTNALVVRAPDVDTLDKIRMLTARLDTAPTKRK